MSSFPVLAPETFMRDTIEAQNRDRIYPEVQRELVNALPPIYIFSICPTPIVQEKTGRGQSVIPACAPGEEVSLPLVIPGMPFEYYDRGEKELGLAYHKGMDIAVDL